MASVQPARGKSRGHAGLLTVMYGAYWAVLTYLLLAPKLPRTPIPMDRRGLIAHVTTFTLLGLGCGIVHRARGGLLNWRWAGIWLAIFAAYATATELIQPYVGRHRDLADWLADMGGVIVGMGVLRLIHPPAKDLAATPTA